MKQVDEAKNVGSAVEELKTGQGCGLRFVYEKTALYRTIHPSGAWATITPQGEIQAVFYSDVRPLPEFTEILFPTAETLNTGDKTEGVIREAEVAVLLHPEIAVRLIELLQYVLERNNLTSDRGTNGPAS